MDFDPDDMDVNEDEVWDFAEEMDLQCSVTAVASDLAAAMSDT